MRANAYRIGAQGAGEPGAARRRGRLWRTVVGSGLGTALLVGSVGTAATADEGDRGDEGDDPEEGADLETTEEHGEFESCEADFGYGKVVVVFDDPDFDPDQVESREVVPYGEPAEDCPPLDDDSLPLQWQPRTDWSDDYGWGPFDLAGFDDHVEWWFGPGTGHGVGDLELTPPDGPFVYLAEYRFRDDADYRVDVSWNHPDQGLLEVSEAFDACNVAIDDSSPDSLNWCEEQSLMNPVVFSVAEPDPEPGPACPAGEVPSAGFLDVAAGNVHADAIDCLAWHEIALGTSAESYDPAGTVTRGQKASFVARMLARAGVDLPDVGQDAFGDVAGSTHAEAINQLAELGIVEGRTADTFEPGARVTRGQSAAMIVRSLDLVLDEELPAPSGPFTDVPGTTHETAIDAAAEAGIALGVTATTFEPGADTRRDQMASLLARTLELLAAEGHVGPPAGEAEQAAATGG